MIPTWLIGHCVEQRFKEHLTLACLKVPRVVDILTVDITRPWAFFDGACRNHQVVLGFLLHLGQNHHYTFKANYGEGTNNKGELLACFFLLKLASHIRLQVLQVYGGSSLVINDVKGTIRITSLSH